MNTEKSINIAAAAFGCIAIGLGMLGLVVAYDAGLLCPRAPQRTAYNESILLPIEAFGANLHVKRFRKGVEFPSNFDLAFARALAEAEKFLPDKRVTITFGPRTWRTSELRIGFSEASGNIMISGDPQGGTVLKLRSF
jgi:hypothetical protein